MSAEPVRLTVFIPVWNREQMVAEAIESVLDQDVEGLECLVIDDGSTDATAERVVSFRDTRVRLERNEQRLGIPRTRNRGIDLARGEYLALLDSDDRCLPGRLSTQLRFLEMHPEVAAVGSWARAMRADGRATRRIHRCPASREALAFTLCFRCAPRQSTWMLRREVLAESRYDERCAVSQDLELLGRLVRDHELRALQEPLVLFRHHPDRVTEQPHPERDAIRRRVFEQRLRECGVEATPETLDRHLRLTGRSEGRGDPDPGFVAWAGGWLEELALRHSGPGPGLHPEVAAVAARQWGKLLAGLARSRAARGGRRELPLDAAPALTRALGPRAWLLRARSLAGF